MKEKIVITDEMIQQRADEGGTFSSEYWKAMSPEQRSTLEQIRQRKLSLLSYAVSENEKAAGIQEAMIEYRGLRIRKIARKDEEIRDLYFAIMDENLRIRAMHDLLLLEAFRRHYFNSTRVVEAFYKYEEIRDVIFQEKGAFKRWMKYMAFAVATYVGALLFKRPDVEFAIAASIVTYYLLSTRQLELHNNRIASETYLRWEIEKERAYPYGVGENGDSELSFTAEHVLFSEEELKTGIRGPRVHSW